MTQRTTKADIYEAVESLSKWTGLPLFIEWAYGAPRIYIEDGREYRRELSPRLQPKQLLEWIYAFSKGFEYGLKAE